MEGEKRTGHCGKGSGQGPPGTTQGPGGSALRERSPGDSGPTTQRDGHLKTLRGDRTTAGTSAATLATNTQKSTVLTSGENESEGDEGHPSPPHDEQ